jgi:hypothetical protein
VLFVFWLTQLENNRACWIESLEIAIRKYYRFDVHGIGWSLSLA